MKYTSENMNYIFNVSYFDEMTGLPLAAAKKKMTAY